MVRRIQSDIDAALELDVNGVPTFYVNGSRVEPLPFSYSVIEDELHLINSTIKLTVQVTDSINNNTSHAST